MIIYYNNLSDEIVINKNLEEISRENISLKKTIDFTTPVIELKLDNVNFNYVYIDELDRYYFVRTIESVGNHLFNVYLECDVIETYKETILNSNAEYMVKLQEYQNVNTLSQVKKEYEIFKSDKTLERNDDKYIITVMNGGY